MFFTSDIKDFVWSTSLHQSFKLKPFLAPLDFDMVDQTVVDGQLDSKQRAAKEGSARSLLRIGWDRALTVNIVQFRLGEFKT